MKKKFITDAIDWCWHTYDENKPLMTYSLYPYVCDKCESFEVSFWSRKKIILSDKGFSMNYSTY